MDLQRQRLLAAAAAAAALVLIQQLGAQAEEDGMVGPSSARYHAPTDQLAQLEFDILNAGPGRGHGHHPRGVPRRERLAPFAKYSAPPHKLEDFVNFTKGPFEELASEVARHMPDRDRDVAVIDIIFFVLYRLKQGVSLKAAALMIGVCPATASGYWGEVMPILSRIGREELAPVPGLAEYLADFMPDELKMTGVVDGMALPVQTPVIDLHGSYSGLRKSDVMQVQHVALVDGSTVYVGGKKRVHLTRFLTPGRSKRARCTLTPGCPRPAAASLAGLTRI